MKFFEDILGLPNVWDCLHGRILNSSTGDKQHKGRRCTNKTPKRGYFNENEKSYSYRQYMNQLSDFEIDLFYSAYFEDFELFDYNPCEGLSG